MNPAKAALRAQALKRRGYLQSRKDGMAARGMDRLLFRYLPIGRGTVVAGYWPLGSELDVRALLDRLRARGCRVALPVVIARNLPLVFRLWRGTGRLEAGLHGTHHPPQVNPRVKPDVVLVPMLAYDRTGLRLGYGGGYYDRTLAALRRRSRRWGIAVGIAFAGQKIAILPKGAHDQRLDCIVTERGYLPFR
ncbi:MAG: 5-formyltetrahydrofolate cyclo-ligase [Alphaproteobacteria bacterium]|nr:5-formyltetrahydrofolate cyclo-ligase [Alphaproteobacteria bacterium]